MDLASPNPDFPDLHTPRLYLRALNPGDTDFIYEHFRDPLVTRYLLDADPVASRAEAQALLIELLPQPGGNYYRWGIELVSTGRLVGTCGFHLWSRRNRRAEIGYDLTPAYWGQGLMFESLQAVLHHGFNDLGLQRVQAQVYPPNTASSRLLGKLGFQLEGVLRAYYFYHNQFYDHELYSLLRPDWAAALKEG
jgi:ribosomal-protein-alanine N-acetyltransferase